MSAGANEALRAPFIHFRRVPSCPSLSRVRPSLRSSADCAAKQNAHLSLVAPTTRDYAGPGRRSFLSAVSCFCLAALLVRNKNARPGSQEKTNMQFKEQNEQPSQRQTAKEVIVANIQILIEQLESGHSDALTAYLTAMGRFHHYSFGNILEIARQNPDAQRVAGLHVWNRFGRRVKKGEKGIGILAPIIAAKRQTNDETEKDVTTKWPCFDWLSCSVCFRCEPD